HRDHSGGNLSLWLQTTTPTDDLEAVCCFIVNAAQVSVTREAVPGAAPAAAPVAAPAAAAPAPAPVPEPTPVEATPAPEAAQDTHGHGDTADRASGGTKAAKRKESGSIRVGVEKVDQIINLVGELVITQAMLLQTSQTLDPVLHDRLLNGIEQLERNARDLQEAVMSIRMMPMDYVFSRFPRVVRENATKLGKRIRLVTKGQATELDKSLIE